MRTVGAMVCLGLLVAACGTMPGGPRLAGGYKLYEAVSSHNSQQVSVIDSRSHAAERRLPLGVASSDWKHLYSIVGVSLVDTDPQTGATLNAILLPGTYHLPPATITGVPGGMSPNGRWVVVESFEGSANTVPTATHMLMIDTAVAKVVHRVNLNGYFNFDAVSNDGLRLYLIQYLNGKEYYVRLYNVSAGALDANIVVDKSDGNQAMAGVRLSGVTSRNGNWLFSMYVRQNQGPFIHALGLDGAFAFCLDLPGSGFATSEAEMHWSLAMNRDGTRLYAVNGATGVVAEVDISSEFNPQVKRTAHIAGGKSAKAGSNAAVLSPDGKTLVAAGANGIEWIDTGTLTTRMQALGDWHVWSLGLSPDGSMIYAVGDNGHIAEIAMSSGQVAHTFDPAEGQPMGLMRVAAS